MSTHLLETLDDLYSPTGQPVKQNHNFNIRTSYFSSHLVQKDEEIAAWLPSAGKVNSRFLSYYNLLNKKLNGEGGREKEISSIY